ncbi:MULTISPECIES: diguanylate cyclase [unclassified Exiguobacterium]|uniref:sensor domain-containing diguanylate cyclase n=1 Tax=unclassified Exiguobacterium TaxID=2644629 RepID=UPI001BEB37D2|nr:MULTISPECIES: diguanylate cyclase [unclassified Exiguobacterium]
MVYGLLIGGTVLITIVLNILRLMTTPALNRWLLAGTSSLVVIWHGVLFDFYDLHWSVLLLIMTGLVCFHWKGMTVAIMVSWLLVYSQSGILSFPLLLSYVFFGLGAALLFGYVKQLKRERSGRLRMLTASSRQLNVFREVSFTMQDTLDPDRLLQTILTSVTAGHGLGFNRSIIFFADLEKDSIYGVMGTGPMNPEDGFQIWEEITRQHYDLQGLIDEKETDSTHDEQLNERIRKMTIPFHGNHLFKQTLDSGRPLHVYASIADDPVLRMLHTDLQMDECTIFPLHHQGIPYGLLVIDNVVNKKPITPQKIDSVRPIAEQASLALHQTMLYQRIETLALRDGLTRLKNHRSFEQDLDVLFRECETDELSLIVMDIDYFKHFNDTNGHLAGNELLTRLASVIRRSVPDEQMAYRFGGEEFVVLLPQYDEVEAAQVAETIRSAVLGTNFMNGERQPGGQLTLSFGVASKHTLHEQSLEQLIECADQALYAAKSKGKNQVCRWEGVTL